MDNEEAYIEQKVPSGVLTSIKFKVLSEEDVEKASVKEIVVASEVTDPALGFPNPASQCLTCGAKDYRTCEGHLGLIKFPFTILHPYFLTEVAQILNKICPGCKTVKNDKAKKSEMASPIRIPKVCKYCDRGFRDVYPPMMFKVSTKDVFGKTAIIAEIKSSRKLISSKSLPPDYWDFVPSDIQQDQAFSTFNRKVLTHAQVYQILKDVDPSYLKGLLGKKNKIFLQNFPLTPNCHRVAEFGQNLTFDIRTRAYRKMIGFRGTANELSSCVIDCIKLCKIRAEKPSLMQNSSSNDENPSTMHGLKYMKEVTLGKRTDFCFRLVCVGDPYIKLDEIGIPQEIAEAMLVSEQLNSLNWDKINASCGLRILKQGETFIKRKGRLVPVRYGDNLHIGDTVYRPLSNGDIVLINRPPSIHPHSLIALRVIILPVNSVLSINPLICNPLRGDFDGDSLHGYIPQSLECRVELRELVSLEKQLADKQSGENLLSLSHDSLTAAHLMLEDGEFLDCAKLQQLQMFCPRQQSKMVMPAVMCKNSNNKATCLWTGRQLFSLLLGKDFDLEVAGARIKRGEFVNLENPSACLREPDDNLYTYLIKNFPGHEFLEFLHSFQELLIEWLSMRGFSVSLLDLYLSHDSQNNMNEEVISGLQESERQAHGQLLMVEDHQDFLSGNFKKELYKELASEKLCHDQQTSAALSRASAAAFKDVFRDVQNLIYNYAPKDNSFVSMLKAGSKGNMLKFVQHSMCLGYQHSLVPLSFRFPRKFSCVSWNEHRRVESSFCLGVDRYVPYGVIESSFLSGLNPLELFVHSVTNRDASFSGHADISGTLFRKLMFFMRDLFVGYDGTVRSCYGNQLVQFSYNSENAPVRKKSLLDDAVCGEPVGSLAACAISEAAYGALDQPISALENSPLLNLKTVLECGVKKLSGNKTASLYLSKKLKRWTNGFEYGAIEVKNHLEKLLFEDVVSLVTILYTPKTGKKRCNSPWICYFRISKEAVSRKQLKVQSIINALKFTCTNSIGLKKSKLSLPKLQIATKDYPEDDKMNESDDVFITAQIVDGSSNSLNLLQDVVVPFLLQTVIKGSSNVKKVDIVWKDCPETPKSFKESSGELYLRVFMSETCERKNFWRVLTDDCLQIMDMIDWERSHPDDIQDVILAQGIDAARNHFLCTLKSVIKDTGKNILLEHLALAADCLSATGEFVPINAKGLSIQRKITSVSSPFTQACFSNPSDCFVKAAKAGASDKLEGTIDALSWGKVPALGTGGRFDILFSGKEHQIDKPQDVYSLLSKSIDSNEEKVEVAVEVNDNKHPSDKKPAPLFFPYNNFAVNGSTDIMKTVLKKHISSEDIKRLSKDLKHILYKYDVNHKLSQDDKLVVWKALLFHPRRDEKIGIGLFEIKIGYHSMHGNSRCFILERVDGTLEDFSYHKCIHHALKLIAPGEAKSYESRWLNGRE